MCKVVKKMFNRCATKTKGSIIPIKHLNLYFKNSVEQDFQVLNLQNSNFVRFFTVEEDGLFRLKCFISSNDLDDTLLIASFNTQEEATEALSTVIRSTNSKSKTILKVLVGLFVVFQILSLSQNQGSNNQTASTQTTSIEQVGTPEDVDAKLKQLQKTLSEINQSSTPEQIDAERKRVAKEMGAANPDVYARQAQEEQPQQQKDQASQWLDKMK